jgi:hypothetical protein
LEFLGDWNKFTDLLRQSDEQQLNVGSCPKKDLFEQTGESVRETKRETQRGKGVQSHL